MTCSLNSDNYKKLLQITTQSIMSKINKGEETLDLKAYIKSIYDAINTRTSDPILALSTAMTIPKVMLEIASSNDVLEGFLAPLHADLVKMKKGFLDPEIMISYLELQPDLLKNLRIAEESQRLSLNNSTEPVILPGPTRGEFKESALAALPFSDTGQEAKGDDEQTILKNIPDTLKALYYKVKRNIILKLYEPSVDGDSSRLNLPGVKPGGIFLTAIAGDKIPSDQKYMKITPKVVLAITDIDGNPILFDDNGEASTTGKIMYYAMRTVNKTGKTYSLNNPDSMQDDKELAETLTNRFGNPVTEEEAKNYRLHQLETLYNIREFILKNPNEHVRTIITGGTLGYIESAETIKTPLKEVKFDDTGKPVFDIQTTEKGQHWNGAVYFSAAGLSQEVALQPANISRDLADKLAKALTNDLYEEKGGKLVKLSDFAKYKLVTNYFEKIANNELIVQMNGETLEILVGGVEKLNLSGEHAFRTIYDILANRYEYPVDNKTVHQRDESMPNWDANLYDGVVVKRVDGTKYKVLSPTIRISSKYLKSPDTFQSFALETRDDKMIISTTKTPYFQVNNETGEIIGFLADNTTIKYKVNAEGHLIKLNAHFEFSPVTEDLNKALGVAEEAPKKKPVEKKSEITTGLPDQDLLNKLDQFNKLHGVKTRDRKATEEQLKAAKLWYDKHPLRDKFPLEVLFNVINTQSAATWSMDAITLFEGSDYTDVYHEAWHGFSQAFLTKEQKTNLYAEVGKKSGSFRNFQGYMVLFSKATDLEIEEYLAEDFREYVLSGATKIDKTAPVRNTLFRKIWDFLKLLFAGVEIHDVVADQKTTSLIHDLYEKLYVGNLGEFTFKESNANFHVLTKGIESTSENVNTPDLGYADSKVIMDSVDSIISNLIDRKNAGLTYPEMLRAAQLKSQKLVGRIPLTNEEKLELRSYEERPVTSRFTTKMLVNKEGRVLAYDYVKAIFTIQKDTFEKSLSEITDELERAVLQKKINTLTWAIDNFGDTDKPFGDGTKLGVINYHNKTSKFMTFFNKYAQVSETDEESTTKDSMGDKKGNEISHRENANAEILYLIRSLHSFDAQTGKPSENNLGFDNLSSFVPTWNKLAKMLEGSRSPQEMEQILRDNEKLFKPITQLLKKLGSASVYKDASEFNMWTMFYRTFNLVRIPITLFNIHQEETSEGDFTYSARAGQSSGNFRNIGEDWKTTWNTTPQSIYISKDENNTTILNVAEILKQYPYIPKGKVYDFLKDIGIGLKAADSENLAKMKEDLEALHTKMNAGVLPVLKYALAKGIPITSLRDIFEKSYGQSDTVKTGVVLNKSGRIFTTTGEQSSWRAIQQIQLKYGDQYTNFMATNAAGNTQFEHSLQSTMSKIITNINAVKTYGELLMIPEMAYLAKKYPFPGASIMLNSIFDEQGMKREGAILTMENLGGVKMITADESDEGTATADLDEFAKFTQDLHLWVLRGTPENPRHSDKSSTFATSVSNLLSPGTTSGKYYIDIDRVIAEPHEANNNLVDIMIKYISAELKRINILKNASEDAEIRNVADYFKQGQDFVMFKDVLSESTRKSLHKLPMSLEDVLASDTPEAVDLRQAIENDVLHYFTIKAQENYDTYTRTGGKGFITSDLISSVKQGSDKAYRSKLDQLGDTTIASGIMKAFTINNWIHNMETIILFYGDLAMYNHAKDEFHKRNSSVAGTGEFHRTDEAAMKFANEVMGQRYAEALGIQTTPFSSIMNTAVLEDTNTRSIYYLELHDKFKRDFLEGAARQGLKGKELTRAVTAYLYGEVDGELGTFDKPIGGVMEGYASMKEGDAQGWITFDAYRILLSNRNEWTPEQEDAYQKIVKGEHIPTEKVLEFFPVQKYSYSGYLANDMELPVMALHKFSVLPLIPSVIGDSRTNDPTRQTNLMKLHEKMMKQNIHYALFKSGSKVGTVTKKGVVNPFYTDYNTFDFDTEGEFTKNKIHLGFLKNQLHTGNTFKGKSTFSSQMRKLIEDGLMEGGVPVDFMPEEKDLSKRKEIWDNPKTKRDTPKYNLMLEFEKNVERLTEIKKEELYKEANWYKNDQGQWVGSIKDMIDFVKQQFDAQDMAEHEKDFLDFYKDNPNHDLSISLSASKIERLLTALVNKRLIRPKVNGEALIQVSGAGFETLASIEGKKNLKFKKATDEEKRKYGSRDLPTYHVGADGKTVAMGVKLAVQGNFAFLLYLPEVKKLARDNKITNLQALNILIRDEEWLNTGDNRRMITMIGTRIPTQGLNSMEFMQVYEFLDKSAGNIIIPPAEIVAKSGSDFDIDKLTVTMPNLYMINGKVKLYKKVDTLRSIDDLLSDHTKLTTEEKKIRQEHQAKIELIKKKASTLFTPELTAEFNALEQEYNNKVQDTQNKIDKALIPYQKYVKSKDKYTTAQGVAITQGLEELYKAKSDAINDKSDAEKEFYKKMKTTLFDEENSRFQTEVEPIQIELENVVEQLKGEKGKSYENEILWNVKSILEMPDNFGSLVRPNGTDLVKGIADELSSLVQTYNPKKNVYGPETKKGITGTRALEYRFNLHKHTENSVGKQSLAIGAIDNTYNTMFNRVGAYMPTVYKNKYGKTQAQNILLPHNTMTIDGEEVISLSHIYDKNNVNKISDIINQLINGWVDVAKDSWIANIQGNKEVSPTLLFMIQAGVPFKQAVYFASQPLVREYVEEQRFAKSTISRPLGKHPGNPMWFRSSAQKVLLTKYNLMDQSALTGKGFMTAFRNLTSKIIGSVDIEKAFSEKTLRENIVKFSEEKGQAYSPSGEELAAFFHYLELEKMGTAVRDVKMRTNFDTKKSTTLMQASMRDVLIDQLMEDERIPRSVIKKILNESPIGSFRIMEFMKDIWSPFFSLRQNSELDKFILEKLAMKTFQEETLQESQFDDAEEFWEGYKNDLMSFIFQNVVKGLDIAKIKEYKGFLVEEGTDVQELFYLRQGAWVKEISGQKRLFIDKKTLSKQFQHRVFETVADKVGMELGYNKATKLALVHPGAIKTEKEYNKFVLERESLRSIYGTAKELAKVKDTDKYKTIVEEIKNKLPKGELSTEDFNLEVNQIAFEIFLRDKALDNSFNSWKMFQSEDNYAHNFMQIKKKFPHLAERFYLFQIMGVSAQKKRDGTIVKNESYRNLFSLEANMDGSTLNLLHSELEQLANLGPEDVPNKEDRDMINNFFKRFPVYAFMQSGMTVKGVFSLTRFVPTKDFVSIISGPANILSVKLNKAFLTRFYALFKNNTMKSNRGKSFRHKNYVDDLTFNELLRAKVDKETVSTFEQAIKPTSVEGVLTYDFDSVAQDSGTNKKIRENAIIPILNAYPNGVFIFNTINNTKNLGQAELSPDGEIFNIKTGLKVGIPTKTKFRDRGEEAVKGSITDSTLEENKMQIDAAMLQIMAYQNDGKTLIFSEKGYGQGMIGIDPDTGAKSKSAEPAPQTFLYLSEQLFKKFGFINPGYVLRGGREVVQEFQPVTDDEVVEFKKMCSGLLS